MKLHELKIKKKYLIAITEGRKTFELRKNDRDYQEGDLISFKVLYDDGTIREIYTVYRITYVLKDVPEYGLQDGYCILGIKELEENY